MTSQQSLTYGQKAVGLKFNPSGDSEVNDVKEMYAHIIDRMDALRDVAMSCGDPEKARLFSIAITEAQGAQMWSVKAITWSD
jgi:hypothetical protein